MVIIWPDNGILPVKIFPNLRCSPFTAGSRFILWENLLCCPASRPLLNCGMI
jgi:hypothetical protein